MTNRYGPVRALIVVLGDQLSLATPSLRHADPERDVVVMAEVEAEILRHPNHKQRVVQFLSAMRHFRKRLEGAGFRVRYGQADAPERHQSLPDAVAGAIRALRPDKVVMTEPGRYDLIGAIRDAVSAQGLELDLREDDHFLCSHEEFETWAEGRKRLTMEYFYREMRRRLDVLMDEGEPAGGQWNFDKENRDAFEADPGPVGEPDTVQQDPITSDVIELVHRRYPELPGNTTRFAWPVTTEQARALLHEFVLTRLRDFGRFQDAMWTDRPFLYHSRLSAALNLKLLDPREVVHEAVAAYERGDAPLNSVEGFVRQIIGWREFMRGIYWRFMPGLAGRNALQHERPLPDLFWTGDTEMVCMSQTVGQLLQTGFAHHIQRLMVTGLFAMLYGTDPGDVHDWYMAMFVDSVEWVTLPNVIGMSQFADGGIVGTKPYAASGAYIDRQSNYCTGCRFDPRSATGENACPFTALYWDFLDRHSQRLAANHRMTFQLRNLERKPAEERSAIQEAARRIRDSASSGRL